MWSQSVGWLRQMGQSHAMSRGRGVLDEITWVKKHAMATGYMCLGRSHQNCNRHKLKLSSLRMKEGFWRLTEKMKQKQDPRCLYAHQHGEREMLSWISCSGPSRQVTSLTSLKSLHSYSNHHLTKAYAAITPCFAILNFKNYILLICSRKFCFFSFTFSPKF